MRTEALPRWDMTPYYPGIRSDAFERDVAAMRAAITGLREMFDTRGVRRDGASADGDLAGEAISRLNDIQERMRLLRSYAYAFVTTDTRDADAQAARSELESDDVEITKLQTRFTAWIGTIDVDALIAGSATASDHAFALRRMAESARHQMSEAEEDLEASLGPSGRGAFSKLHRNVTSRIMVPFDGRELPMSAVRALAHDPDAGVRERAYRAELDAWASGAVPLAAAINSVKGWTNVVNARRGWSDALEPALFANNTDRATLDAMQEACVGSFGDFRRYLRAKARLLGRERLPWWDLFAPVGAPGRGWSWDDGEALIAETFDAYSPKLGSLAHRAFAERWIDAEPREGKVDGGFCMGVRGDESRILVNFEPAFGGVSTVAHELGHAYHNTCLAPRTPLQRVTPMALAETASIFCQTIVLNELLREAGDAERLAILEADLQHTCQIVVDIHSRFLFEKALFEGRERRELQVEELCASMLDAQRATYGDGLDPDALHAYMWAMKPHYYGSSYYNWPYTFGLLFGLGLYERYVADPDGFRAGYDDLLASTGSQDAATLAARFGIDVRDPAFWRSSLDVIRRHVDAFEVLVQGTSG